MFKKIQEYLLPRYPLLWQSKFVPMIIIGIFAWIIAYGTGYLATNIKVIQDHNLTHYYTRYFLSIHIIAGLIIYVLWALYFFRTNPIFQFYPLQRNYLLLLYIQLFFPLLIICSLYYPFTYGAYSKTESILSESELMEESRVINLAYPFLVVTKDDYRIQNRVYPEPFPLNSFYTDEEERWTNNLVYYKPAFKNGRFDTANNFYLISPEDPVTFVDHASMVFYKSHNITEKHDSCHSNSYDIIDSFFTFPANHGLHYYSVQNFSGVYLDVNEKNMVHIYPEENYLGNKENNYREYIAPSVYAWTKEEQADSIKFYLEGLRQFCLKYGIRHHIPVQLLVETLMHNHFKVTTPLTDDTYEFNRSEDDETIADLDLSDIHMIYKNYSTAKDIYFYNDIFIALLALTLLISALLLIVYCIDFISILISVPVAGIVMLFCGLVALGSSSHTQELITFFLIVAVLLVILGYFAVGKNKMNKRQASILLSLGFYSLPFLSGFLLYLIERLTTEMIFVCGQEQELRHYHIEPWHIIVLGTSLFLLYMPLLKKLRSKEE